VKFGILYNIDYRPEVHTSPSSYYGQILDQVQLLEELGFDAVWFGEHHYSGYSFGNPAVIATAAAARTKRIRLGTECGAEGGFMLALRNGKASRLRKKEFPPPAPSLWSLPEREK